MSTLLSLLKSFISQGNLPRAVETFSLILRRSPALAPDTVSRSLSSLLPSCAPIGPAGLGNQLHAYVVSAGLLGHPSLVSRLVAFYSGVGLLPAAVRIAEDHSDGRDPLPWNIVISAHVRAGRPRDALSVYRRMLSRGALPDAFTYPPVLKACGDEGDIGSGEDARRAAENAGFGHSVFVRNSLISMYSKLGEVGAAREVFDGMPVRDAVSWSSVIACHASAGMWRDARELFGRMRAEAAGVGISVITWNTVGSGCVRGGDFSAALTLLSEMAVSGVRPDHVAMVNGLNACSRGGFPEAGREIHCAAVRGGHGGATSVRNALISMYSNCGGFGRAEAVFRSTEAKDVVTWNSAIAGYARAGRAEEAASLVREMAGAGGERPNDVTAASLIPLCARSGNLRHGRELHGRVVRAEEGGRLLLWNALVEMYARAGSLAEARRVFDSVRVKDEVTYTSLISGYGMRGEGRAAVELFGEMEAAAVRPDGVTMVAVLTACSHSGMVSAGERVFRGMVSPETKHFACVADMYGRAGMIREAAETIAGMPFRPTPAMWATLLGACLVHRNADVGEWAAGKLLEAEPELPGHYVLAANMYAAGGRWEKLSEVRKLMRDLGVGRSPGRSWVLSGDGYVPFMAGDTANPHSSGLYSLLFRLNDVMREDRVFFTDDMDLRSAVWDPPVG